MPSASHNHQCGTPDCATCIIAGIKGLPPARVDRRSRPDRHIRRALARHSRPGRPKRSKHTERLGFTTMLVVLLGLGGLTLLGLGEYVYGGLCLAALAVRAMEQCLRPDEAYPPTAEQPPWSNSFVANPASRLELAAIVIVILAACALALVGTAALQIDSPIALMPGHGMAMIGTAVFIIWRCARMLRR